MSLSTQCLYFHLLLQSDDDGFVVNPKRVMKQIRASEEDMQILIDKGYAHVADTGISIISE